VTSERWPQVKALFQAASEQPTKERGAFLAAATTDDEALRREVESLLTSDTSDVSFLDRLPVASESGLADPLDRTANQTALPAIAMPTSHVLVTIAIRRHSGGRGAFAAELPGAVADATSARSSKTNCATEMSAMHCRPSFSRHRRRAHRRGRGELKRLVPTH
jgi:hypothetical protein